MSKTYQAISILIGTIIGAGILGIPFVVMQSGFGIGLINIILIAFVMTFILLYLGEIGLRTKANHHLTGYAELYLGKKGKILMFAAFVFGIYSALIAYLIGEGESFSSLIFNSSQYSLHLGVIFWLLLSALTYFGLKALEDVEELGVSIIIILIVAIIAKYWNKIEIENLSYNNPALFFVPFGVILFAFIGFSAMPEVERILKNEKEKTFRTIILSSVFVTIVYIIFAAIVLGSQGSKTPEISTLALGKPFVLLGILSMFTSYLALSIAMIDTLRFDFKFSRRKAWLLTIVPTLILYLILSFTNLAGFIRVIAIDGIVSGGLAGILILLMIKNAKLRGERKPEYKIPYSRIFIWILILILVAGAVLEIWSLF